MAASSAKEKPGGAIGSESGLGAAQVLARIGVRSAR
jgi:hypothetical protein